MHRAFVLLLLAASCAPPLPERDGGVDAGVIEPVRDAGVIAMDAGFPEGPCGTGAYWTQGTQGSQLMSPGHDCVFCHRNEEGAPPLLTAGTVMAGLHDVDDCRGVAGAVVRIVGADGGGIVELTTNEAGNFFLGVDAGTAIALPYTASVIFEGRVRAMTSPQTMFDCMLCHSARGGGAPGRIQAP